MDPRSIPAHTKESVPQIFVLGGAARYEELAGHPMPGLTIRSGMALELEPGARGPDPGISGIESDRLIPLLLLS
jgi:hypothetical protein